MGYPSGPRFWSLHGCIWDHFGDDFKCFFWGLLKDLGGDLGSIFEMNFGLISAFVLAELRSTDRPRRVREAKRINQHFDGFSD